MGYKELHLVVTIGNYSAQHGFVKLGFNEVIGEREEILTKLQHVMLAFFITHQHYLLKFN
jgi:hypothetical protein